MSGSALMALGMRAMTASYAALQTTGHNIANANVDGYSRQSVEVSTAKGLYSGSGYFGKGVDVTTVTRAHDEFLTREASNTRSAAALDSTRLSHLQQLEKVFPTGEAGVGYAAGQFLNAMSDLASHPSDSSARQVVLARAGDVASGFAAAGAQMDDLQAAAIEEMKADVTSVNQMAKSVAQLNDQIAAAKGLGQPPNDLLDQRDKLISDISQKIQVSAVPATDGTVGLFVGGGQRLVLGKEAQSLAVVPSTEDPSRFAIAITDNGISRRLSENSLAGGSLSGLLRFQNVDLVQGRTLMGQMAAAFAGKVNQQQSLGLDLSNPSASGAPMFDIGAPQAVPANTNGVDAAGKYIGSVNLSVSDASQLQASEYDLQADPAGGSGVWQLTRRSDGLVRNIHSGDTVDGVTITIGTPAPVAGDRFLLQPVTRAADGMARAIDDPRGVAAALAVTSSTGAANAGTATVSALRAVSTSLNPQNTANITFTNGTGAYNWELRDRSSNALVSSGTGTWTPGSPIALNGFELELSGVPKSGDTVSVSKTQFPASNNGNALAFVGLRDTKMVGLEPQNSGGLTGGNTITDAYAAAMSGIGVRVQGAQQSSDISSGLATQAESARAAQSGVNLDEEAARLIQYQQAYQAAAKVLQVAQSLFQTLLQTAGS